jgi:hypothetical protein
MSEAFARKSKTLILLVLLSSLAYTSFKVNISNAATPIFFSPSPIDVGTSETELPTTFNVSVKIGQVSDLSGWQINITYDTAFVQAIRAFVPADNVFAGKNPVVTNPIIDNIVGSILYGAWNGPGQASFNGEGTLCTIEFKAIKPGVSPIAFVKLPETMQNLFPTRLYDSNYDDIPISYSDSQINVHGYIPTPKYTKLEISPSTLKVGGDQLLPVSFSVNITVYNVTELTGWQVNVRFLSNILNVVNITRPPDDIFSNENVTSEDPVIDNEAGFLSWNVTLVEGSPFSGNGTLCTIEFKGISLGISLLQFDENQTILVNAENQPISCELLAGSVQVIQKFEQAILEVSPYQIDVNETQNYFLVNITVANVTDLSEWRINLEFNGSILKIQNYSIPQENVFKCSKFSLNPDPPQYNDSNEGYFIWGARVYEGFSFYGDGVLCQIFFHSVSTGLVNFTLSQYGEDTYLLDSTGKLINATVIDAGRPPTITGGTKPRPIEFSYILGPLGLLFGILAIFIILRLRRRKIELSGGEPIYYKKV